VTEEPLAGGNVAATVVRVGDTVRKPATPATPAVTAVLAHLAVVGFDGAPRARGADPAGRQILEYVPGVTADNEAPMGPAELRRVGRLIRGLHDALAGFRPPADARWDVVLPPPGPAELVGHHDLAPWNLVRDGERWVFIDWDGAGPTTRLWDLAYAAHGFVGMAAGGDPGIDGERLRSLVDGYRLDDVHARAALAPLIGVRIRGMYDLLRASAATGAQPWARLWEEGHGDHWGPAADYAAAHAADWRDALLQNAVRPVPCG
jgi:Ser/Thr protein kinase RdoA (MazF antagonist)